MLREGGASSKRSRAVITGSSACADDDREYLVQQPDSAGRQVERGGFGGRRPPDFQNRIIEKLLIDQPALELAARLALVAGGYAVLQMDGRAVTVGKRDSGYERHLQIGRASC